MFSMFHWNLFPPGNAEIDVPGPLSPRTPAGAEGAVLDIRVDLREEAGGVYLEHDPFG